MKSLINNIKLFTKSFAEGLQPIKDLTVTEWSNMYRILPSSTSAEPGKYSSDKTPFLVEIMDVLSANCPIQEIILMKSAQIGGSELGNNWVGYIIDNAPGPMMIVLPTTESAKKYSKIRIDPMIQYCPTIKNKVAAKNSKEQTNNVTFKEFLNGFLSFVGANSGTQLRSLAIKYLFIDEVDAMPTDVDGEGSPIELAKKRTTTFLRRKIFEDSTPTTETSSQIKRDFLRGDQRYYHVSCPFCSAKQKLVFDNLKYEINPNNKNICIPESVYYQCLFCEKEIKESYKYNMMKLENAEWVPENPDAPPHVRSYHINSLYSPWQTWIEIVDMYLKAKHDPFLMKTFINTVLGETYKEDTVKPDYLKLMARAEDYEELTAPKEVVYINAGIDTQDNRLAVIINGFGAENEIFTLYYDEIIGSPRDPLVWQQLRRLIDRPIKHASGIDLFVNQAAIDSAGHNTDYVYDFCKKNSDKFIPIVGRGDIGFYMKQGKSISIDMNGKKYDNPINLYHVNTIQSKKSIYNFLQNETPGPQYIHFGKFLKKNFFEMLTSEELVTKIIKGQQKEEFIKANSSVRNEALDVFCYSYALAYSKGVTSLYGSEYDKVYNNIITSKLPKEPEPEPEKTAFDILRQKQQRHSKFGKLSLNNR